MPVSDFECQIVRGQIGRYLNGDVLSPQALAGLEEHLAECPGCKAVVAERRAALMGTLTAPTRAVVSMPVENPLVAALRARAEEESVEPAPKAGPGPKTEVPAKAAPRYAKAAKAGKTSKAPKAAPPKGNLAKPLTLAALLAVVLLGMSRLTHTVTAPAAKASSAFATNALPETPAQPVPSEKPQDLEKVEPSETPAPQKAVEPPTPQAVEPKPTPAASVAAPVKPEVKTPAAKSAPKADGSWGDLFQANPKAISGASAAKPTSKNSVARKVLAPTPRTIMTKPRPVLRRVKTRPHVVARVVRRLKVARRPKVVHRAPHATVRVYGLDGRPLKP